MADDLEAELRGLRDELNAAIPLPELDKVTGRSRTRRRLQLGAVVAVVAVALSVPVLRALPDQEAAQPAAPSTSYLLDFADADHGYALARRCVVADENCQYALYRTADGGRDWQPRQLPPAADEKTGYRTATLFVLGPDAVTIERPKGDTADRIASVDGGRTWTMIQRPWAAATVRPPLSRDALLVGACGEKPVTGQACDNVGTIEPSSGTFVPAPSQPPLTAMNPGSVATASGRWWVVGKSVTTGRGAISVSSDGLTWATSTLGHWAEPMAVVESDGVMYAAGNDSDGETHGLGVWISVNGGRSWDLMGITPLSGLVGTPVAAGDGSLTVSDGARTYVSTDMGRSFRSTGAAAGTVKWTRAGYLRMNADRFALSTDGSRWRDFTVR